MSIIKVTALEGGSRIDPEAPSLSLTVRITEILDYLQGLGKLFFMVIAENDRLAMSAVDWADVIIINKYVSLDTLSLAEHAREHGKKIIYDIDDWIFSYPNYSTGKRKATMDGIMAMLKLADVVTVANETIFQAILSYYATPKILPGGVNVEKYLPKSLSNHEEATPPRVLFTNGDLLKIDTGKDMFIRALQVFFLRRPDYILDFTGDPFPEIASLSFLHFNYRIEYPDYMRNLAAGGYQFAITPLGGQEEPESLFFNRCKSFVKYLNYGATRIPGVYSLSPIYEECITQEKTGLLVENTYEGWINGMEALASSPQLRQSIRDNAYEDVLQKHHIRFSAEVLMDIILHGKKNLP